ncbi:chitin synthase chs-2-like [Saccostrea cucullata]|uniref:chitin synthase chs-2-like n=1 Tax=Saccostrea cuccullata TaxID=36930 RepID=UPI002ED17A05
MEDACVANCRANLSRKITKWSLLQNGLETDNKQRDLNEETKTNSTIPPLVYACATMWHETRFEMVQLLKSLFRLDEDQFNRAETYKFAKEEKEKGTNETNLHVPEDYYEFEAHIMFDDAFNDEGRVNDFVKTFASVINESASAVHGEAIELEKPFLFNTIYGGQVIYRLPGGNLMFIHLKDKSKIRHKKRWSQVMYMYYLLGYRLTTEISHKILKEAEENSTGVEVSESLDDFDIKLKTKAENTFLLALDGDVDFTPGSVRLLIDRMRKDERVGAACGRIHPIGSGPIVWYQKFEYAVAHWLQKATEHVLGCVLCSPGCFSLFRGSALMDNNVMKKYTLLPSEASHHLMYDQGEDRWLCTLLLQQGYRVDYSAGADAFTYAPEGFNEYFNQRKRWGPSTLANIMSLLQDSKNTVKTNSNISWLYIFYQASLMVATLIGPATILMMIAGAFVAVFGTDLVMSYIASLIPAILYFIICVTCSKKIQLIVAQILSGLYVIIMMVVLVGVIITAVTESPFHPSVVFLIGIVAIFVFAALCHPREWSNLIFGFLYFILVPSGFLILIIYSLCNLNDVSWGTRESGTSEAKVKQKKGVLSKILYPYHKLKKSLSISRNSEKDAYINLLKSMTDVMEQSKMTKKRTSSEGDLREVIVDTGNKREEKETENSKAQFMPSTVFFCFIFGHVILIKTHQKVKEVKSNKDSGTGWIANCVFPGTYTEMKEQEANFWRIFVNEYLEPIKEDKDKEKKVEEELRELRNNVCGGMALINLLWISVNFLFQLRRPTVVTFVKLENGEEIKTDILGLLFIIFFTLILLIQFCGMIMHRWGTFLHLVAITEIPNPFKSKGGNTVKEVRRFCKVTQADQFVEITSEEEMMKEQKYIKQQIFSLQETGRKDNVGHYEEESPTDLASILRYTQTRERDLNSMEATRYNKNTSKTEEAKRVRFAGTAEAKRNIRETIMRNRGMETDNVDTQQGENFSYSGGLMQRRLCRSKRDAKHF